MENFFTRRNNNWSKLLCIFILAFLSISCHKKELSKTAILFFNATTIDVTDGRLDLNQAFLIDHGIIKSIGSYEELESRCLPENQYNLEGRYIIPGLWDAHVHILERWEVIGIN